MTPPPPATRRTMYFVGVTTAASSIHRVFPLWAERLGIGDAALVGVDFPLQAPADAYRRFVSFLSDDALSQGALVTTHKIDLFTACRDLFAGVDPYARALGEASCVSKGPAGLVASAKDPLTSGLALRAFLPAGHWAATGAEALILGAGGAGAAIAWHLTHDPAGGPGRIVVTDTDPGRLARIGHEHEAGSGGGVELVEVGGTSANDALLERLPPGSLVVNATGMGKDRPGSPLSGEARFPEAGFAWELNYRGELTFLEQARAQQRARSLRVEDGWVYFLHGWLQIIGEVFHLDAPTAGPEFDFLADLAAGLRG